jgi:hypothetical protein
MSRISSRISNGADIAAWRITEHVARWAGTGWDRLGF